MLFGNKDGNAAANAVNVAWSIFWSAMDSHHFAEMRQQYRELRVLECALFFWSVVAFAGQHFQIVIISSRL